MHWNPLDLTRIMYYPTLHFKEQEGQGGQGVQGEQGGQGGRGGARGEGGEGRGGHWNYVLWGRGERGG